MLHFDTQGFPYDFDLSGKEFPTPDGGTTSWREVNPTTWEGTDMINGKVIATIQLTLKTETVTAVMKATRAGGRDGQPEFSWARVPGGSGFLGKFEINAVKGAPLTVEIALDGANGITGEVCGDSIRLQRKLNGKDHPLTGARTTLKQTLAFEKTGQTR